VTSAAASGPRSPRGRAARIVRAWVALLGERETGESLALFRVAVGVVTLWSLLSVARAGLVEAFWMDAADGGVFELSGGDRLLALLGGPARATVWTLFGLGVAGAAFVASGLRARASAVVALVAYKTLVSANTVAWHAYDVMITNALWICVLADTSRTLSLDCRLRTGTFTSAERVHAWPRYIGVFQLVVIYFWTGIQKLSPAWTPIDGYSALYWIFQDHNWRRFDMAWTAWLYPATQVATAVSWLWEVSAPLLLAVFYFRRTSARPGRLRAIFNRRDLRRYFALFGVVFHLAIFATLEVGPFSFVALAFYFLLFGPREWAALWSRVRGEPTITRADPARAGET
jgi:hypothetical protein